MIYESYGRLPLEEAGFAQIFPSLFLSSEKSRKRKIEEFEGFFADYVGRDYAVLTSMGRTALYLALASLEEKGEAVMQSFLCESVPLAASKAGFTPRLVDINEDYTMKTNFKVGKKTRVLIPVHTYGLPARMDELCEIAEKKNLVIIEDAAHALGGRYKERRIGSIGDAAIFSLTKNIAGIGGGVLVTDEKRIAENARRMRDRAKHFSRFSLLYKGVYKILLGKSWDAASLFLKTKKCIPKAVLAQEGGRMEVPEALMPFGIEAEIASAEMKKLGRNIEKRRENARYLNRTLRSSGVILPKEDKDHIYTLYTIQVKNRDSALASLRKEGILAGCNAWPVPLHKMPAFRKYAEEGLGNTESACSSFLSLPIHHLLEKKDLEKIARVLVSLNEPKSGMSRSITT
jgi:dTDP-4-amino-4,6-dideoxygalactose transaminase